MVKVARGNVLPRARHREHRERAGPYRLPGGLGGATLAKKPKKPALWEKAKADARATSEGSPPGRWSARKAARKAARAQLEYRKRGGGWTQTPDPDKAS